MKLPTRKRTLPVMQGDDDGIPKSVSRAFRLVIQPYVFHTHEPHVLYSTTHLTTEIEIGLNIDVDGTCLEWSQLCPKRQSPLARLLEGRALQLVLALDNAHNQSFFETNAPRIDCDESYACYTEPVFVTCRKRKHLLNKAIVTNVEVKQKSSTTLFVSDSEIQVQMAREYTKRNALNTECVWPITNPADIIKHAVTVGLLHDIVGNTLPTGQSLPSQNRVRISWMSRVFSGFVVELQLIFVVPTPVCPKKVSESVHKGSTSKEIGAAVGATDYTWRVEIEFHCRLTERVFAIGVNLIGAIQRFLSKSGNFSFKSAFAYQPQETESFERSLLTHLIYKDPRARSWKTSNHSFPNHVRPRDAPAGLQEPGKRFVTAKIDGEEAFLIISMKQAYVITKSHVHVVGFVPTSGPYVFEGEWLSDTETFVVCDCLVVPRLSITHLRFELRMQHILATNFQHKLVRLKPFFVANGNPFAATGLCLRWVQAAHLPCDGLIFVNGTKPYWGNILTKAKFHPTIDFFVAENESLPNGHFQLMLRKDKYLLHSPRRATTTNIAIPTVVVAPPQTKNRVLEVLLDNTNGKMTWIPYKTREDGKLANYTSNADAIIRTVASTDTREHMAHIVYSLLTQMIYTFKNSWLFDSITLLQKRCSLPIVINEVGAGNGSNVLTWLKLYRGGSVQHVNLIEPDTERLVELNNRTTALSCTIHNVTFSEFIATRQQIPVDPVDGYFTVWVFSFSLTQVVENLHQIKLILTRCARDREAVVSVQHLYNPDDDHHSHSQGIVWGPLEMITDIPSITMTINYSRLAQSITERMLSLQFITDQCNIHDRQISYLQYTIDPSAHWMLRSLTGIIVTKHQ